MGNDFDTRRFCWSCECSRLSGCVVTHSTPNILCVVISVMFGFIFKVLNITYFTFSMILNIARQICKSIVWIYETQKASQTSISEYFAWLHYDYYSNNCLYVQYCTGNKTVTVGNMLL